MKQNEGIDRRQFLERASCGGLGLAAAPSILGSLLGNGEGLAGCEGPLTREGPLIVDEAVKLEAQAFSLEQVRLLESPFKKAMRRDVGFLLELDPDRLLHNFHKFAGLEPKGKIYGGWESSELAGHSLGHYLSALSMHYAASGDERFRERVDYIVGEFARVQQAHGNGYVGAIPGGDKLWSEIRQGKITEAENFSLNGVWAPWYTQHKIFAGLLDAYWSAGSEQALDVAEGLGDWAYQTTENLSFQEWQHMLQTEYGGMNESLANLYAVTGEERYLELSRSFHDQAVLGPLADRKPVLEGLHGNTQIPKAIGVCRRYQITGRDSLKTIAKYFWNRVVGEHTYVIGGNTQGEHFGPPGSLSERLDASTAETCNTYNMLRLTRYLFSLEPKAKYMDYYERALYNHILASQEPKYGMMTYLMSLKPGHFKTYSTPFNSFWCCMGTGMENHVKYGDTIYFRDEDGLYVNLFIPSELSWEEQGLELRQETEFPNSNETRFELELESPTRMPLRIRRPSWAKGKLAVQVNGEAVETGQSAPGSYLTVERRWEDGDVVEVELPMELHTESVPGNKKRAAILYGPIVLGGALGTEGVPKAQYAEGDPDDFYAEDNGEFLNMQAPPVPVISAVPSTVQQWVRSVEEEGPLTFRTAGVGQPRDVTLKPFYDLDYQRYTVYWDFTGGPDREQQMEEE
jgi:DUF1680 family protein